MSSAAVAQHSASLVGLRDDDVVRRGHERSGSVTIRAMTLVTLAAGDDRVPPIVCVHPVSGQAGDYRLLAAALAWPGRVLGLDAPPPGADGYRIAELAEHHADSLGVDRPVLLLGWSIGGVIAAELSRVVVARGGRVDFLGLLDTRAPQPEMRRRPTDRDSLARFFMFQRALTRQRTPAPPPASSDPEALLAVLRAIGADDGIPDEAALERQLATFMGLIRAFFHHEQRPVPVPLHLFEAADAHPTHPKPATLGWEDLTPELVRHQIAGTHFDLLAPDRVDGLARTIAGCLPEARVI